MATFKEVDETLEALQGVVVVLRDLRAEVTARTASINELQTLLDEERAAHATELKLAKVWTDEDLPLPEDTAINKAHPCESQHHDLYTEALRMVNAKRSKYALVDLVNWLLVERRERDAKLIALNAPKVDASRISVNVPASLWLETNTLVQGLAMLVRHIIAHGAPALGGEQNSNMESFRRAYDNTKEYYARVRKMNLAVPEEPQS